MNSMKIKKKLNLNNSNLINKNESEKFLLYLIKTMKKKVITIIVTTKQIQIIAEIILIIIPQRKIM